MEFIIGNLGTIVVCIILISLIVLAIVKIVRDRKKGKSFCSGGCENCSSYDMCHKNTKK